mgnify:CR=1 FL=1
MLAGGGPRLAVGNVRHVAPTPHSQTFSTSSPRSIFTLNAQNPVLTGLTRKEVVRLQGFGAPEDAVALAEVRLRDRERLLRGESSRCGSGRDDESVVGDLSVFAEFDHVVVGSQSGGPHAESKVEPERSDVTALEGLFGATSDLVEATHVPSPFGERPCDGAADEAEAGDVGSTGCNHAFRLAVVTLRRPSLPEPSPRQR